MLPDLAIRCDELRLSRLPMNINSWLEYADTMPAVYTGTAIMSSDPRVGKRTSFRLIDLGMSAVVWLLKATGFR